LLNGATPLLRLRQDFHPSPTTPNLYEITTTLTNLTAGPLSGVRYERVMDWDVEPTATDEFVTINRGATPPSSLIYSDDNGFGDNLPFSDRAAGTENGPLGPAAEVVNTNYVDRGPDDHGARFTFSFGTLAPARRGSSSSTTAPPAPRPTPTPRSAPPRSRCTRTASPTCPTAPTRTRSPTVPRRASRTRSSGASARSAAARSSRHADADAEDRQRHHRRHHRRDRHAARRQRQPGPRGEAGVQGRGANAARGTATTDAAGNARFGYSGANAGDDTILACLDSNANGGCDAARSPTRPHVIGTRPRRRWSSRRSRSRASLSWPHP
jgi:hypothetical protein